MSRTEKCQDCYFYVPDEAMSGECHRFPRTPTDWEISTAYRWPKMEEDDWCGEFKPSIDHTTTSEINVGGLVCNK